jgi:sortase A
MKSTGQGVFDPGSNPSAQLKPTQGTSGRALLLVGLIFLAVYAGYRIQGVVLSRLAVQSFETAARKVPISDNPRKSGTASQTDFSVWPEPRIQSYGQSPARHSSLALAVWPITSIQLEVRVLNGTDTLILNRGVGWISGARQPGKVGDVGLAGHRDGFFRRFKHFMVSERAELVTYDRTDPFVIDRLRVVHPQDVNALQSGSPSLTLVTYYPLYVGECAATLYRPCIYSSFGV